MSNQRYFYLLYFYCFSCFIIIGHLRLPDDGTHYFNPGSLALAGLLFNTFPSRFFSDPNIPGNPTRITGFIFFVAQELPGLLPGVGKITSLPRACDDSLTLPPQLGWLRLKGFFTHSIDGWENGCVNLPFFSAYT